MKNTNVLWEKSETWILTWILGGLDLSFYPIRRSLKIFLNNVTVSRCRYCKLWKRIPVLNYSIWIEMICDLCSGSPLELWNVVCLLTFSPKNNCFSTWLYTCSFTLRLFADDSVTNFNFKKKAWVLKNGRRERWNVHGSIHVCKGGTDKQFCSCMATSATSTQQNSYSISHLLGTVTTNVMM